MQRVSRLADMKHPLLVEQLFDPVMLVEISKWEEIEERLISKEEEDDFEYAREGAVYFADTQSMHGSIMKIGGSKYDGQTRARTLYNAGVPEPFTCRLEKRFPDWKLYERTIQEYLSEVRVYSNKEFFVLTLAEAQRLLGQIEGTVLRTPEETKKWDNAFSKTKAKLEKYRRAYRLKKEELLQVEETLKEKLKKATQDLGTLQENYEHATKENQTYAEELEILRQKHEALILERNEALERIKTIKDDQTENQIVEHIPEKKSILVPGILPHICKFLTDVRDLGRLCKTNMECAMYLKSVYAGKHWVCAGKLACGEEYWNDALFDRVVGESDGRYMTILHMCPWLAIPRKFKVSQLEGLHLLGERYTILGMEFDKEFKEYGKGDLEILVDVFDDGMSLKHGKMIIETNSMEELKEDNNDFQQEGERIFFTRTDEKRIEEFNLDPSEEEEEIMKELENDAEFMNALSDYGSGVLDMIKIVNNGLFAALFHSGERDRNLLFISMHDKRKILWDMNLGGGDSAGVLFSPGQMWFVTDKTNLWYFGPNKEGIYANDAPIYSKCIINDGEFHYEGHDKFGIDGRIPRAFCSMISGNASLALSILEPMDLDLYSVKAPNTYLTLFDVAADSDNKRPWKGNQNLTPDAAMLLQKEPRFKTSVFMMMRAIYETDNKTIKELISNGLKIMPKKKLYDCCHFPSFKPKLDFEQVCEVLRSLGMVIMTSDGKQYLGKRTWKNKRLL